MSSRNKRSYLVARAREETELAAVALSLQAKIAHLQMAAEYQERAGDFAAHLSGADGEEAKGL